MRIPTLLTTLALIVSVAPADELVPLPAYASTYSANATWGFWFEAPVNILITGLRVPDEQHHGRQNVEIVRFHNSTPPPVYGQTTNAFDSLVRIVGEGSAQILPVSIPVLAGDVIGVLGACGDASTMHNSAGPCKVFQSEILGIPTAITKMGMQFNLATDPAHDLWQEPSG